MSHVTKIELEVKDLDALDAACRRLGLELRRGQQTYRWYGESVGDYPLPEGFTAEDLGKCDHAICIPGTHVEDDSHTAPYEIGVARRRDGRPGFILLYDHWARGHGMSDYVDHADWEGKSETWGKCHRLKQMYGVEVARRQAQRQGFTVTEQQGPQGSVRLQLMKV